MCSFKKGVKAKLKHAPTPQSVIGHYTGNVVGYDFNRKQFGITSPSGTFVDLDLMDFVN